MADSVLVHQGLFNYTVWFASFINFARTASHCTSTDRCISYSQKRSCSLSVSPTLPTHSFAEWLWTALAGGTPWLLLGSCDGDSAETSAAWPTMPDVSTANGSKWWIDSKAYYANLWSGGQLYSLFIRFSGCSRDVWGCVSIRATTSTPFLTFTEGWCSHQGTSHLSCSDSSNQGCTG